MRIAQIQGTVTLNPCHRSLEAGTFKLATVYSLEELRQNKEPTGEQLVIYDVLGAGLGQRILLSEGPEAAQPLRPRLVPIDAYNAGLIDAIHFSATSQDE